MISHRGRQAGARAESRSSRRSRGLEHPRGLCGGLGIRTICACVYIYIYIHIYIYIYICMCMCVYIYIYIYVFRDSAVLFC